MTVSTYVILRDGCSVDFTVLGSDQVEVAYDERKCELLFDAKSLRRFLADGAAALRDMDARFASERAEQSAETDQAVGRA